MWGPSPSVKLGLGVREGVETRSKKTQEMLEMLGIFGAVGILVFIVMLCLSGGKNDGGTEMGMGI